MNRLNFDLDEFLRGHWHQKPAVIRQGFIDFQDPISADELAGLALEPEIDSRLVTNDNGKWQAKHGPFEEAELTQLAESHWQLIIQAANHWYEPLADLLQPFSSLPQWLLDDVMVCYSAPSGGVGPHIDQYDVFIIQGQGQRRWRIGAKDTGQYQEKLAGDALKQIEGFDAEIDVVLNPGDILYIPPGFPHEGQSLTGSLSYSIGYRSPKQVELVSHFADHLINHDLGDIHWHRPGWPAQSHNGQINLEAQQQLTDMLLAQFSNQPTINAAIGSLLSQPRHQLNLLPMEPALSPDELVAELDVGAQLIKTAGLKSLYFEAEPYVVYINGERYDLGSDNQKLVEALCNQQQLTLSDLMANDTAYKTMAELVNKGYWYLSE
ncbi:JmjC domain-containing protein [Vibrio sp.]|uniref:JmjC domain-containing protein n=1 Tax=Vibrio sp. TaxID=678 RepID=UPI003D0C3DFA